jgi:hypothetical protein
MAQEPNTDEEMNDMLLEEQVDPVSGNTAPVGALPSEVRDDIDIRVSENEYVIPAYAVRYFGEGFFDELLGAAEQGWDRIKEGDELPFRDDELETEGDDEEPKEGYAEGGNIPGAGVTVPQPVGGGFGGYGGTGARFSGFESRIYINPETGREMLIFFFNGKPMKRIPQGFRPKGETAVQEQQTVAAERDDDDKGPVIKTQDGYWNKPASEWTQEDYDAYNKSMMDNLRNGKDPLDPSLLENFVTGLIGASPLGLIGGAVVGGAIKKGKQAIAKQAYDLSISGLGSGNTGNIKPKTLAETMFLTAGGLGVTGQTDFTYTAGQTEYSDAQKGTIQTLYGNSDKNTQNIIMTAGEDVAMSMPVSSSSFNLFDPSTWFGGAASTTAPESVVTDDMSFSDWYSSTTGSSLNSSDDSIFSTSGTNTSDLNAASYAKRSDSGSTTPTTTVNTPQAPREDNEPSAAQRAQAAVDSGQKEAKKVTYGGKTRYSGSGR